MRLWKKPETSKTDLAAQVARSGPTGRLIVAQDATLRLDADTHGDRIVLLDRAAGIAVTLPPSTGSGVKFKLVVKTTITSNSTTIKVQNATDVLRGIFFQTADGGNTLVAYDAGSTDDTITFNGSTTGGIVGDIVELTDYAAGFWLLEAKGAATGVEASPLSATVS